MLIIINRFLNQLAKLLISGMCLIPWVYSMPASAAEFCSDNHYVDITLPNESRWDMCWEHRQREGIILHKVHFTPPQGERRMILGEAAVAQIHVPYDDNGARYHDVSDYGLGGRYMRDLQQSECLEGKLLTFANKAVLCQQIVKSGTVFADQDKRLQGDSLNLFSVSKIGAYNYIPSWRFLDDGSIEPGVGASGALQRYGNARQQQHGWLVEANKVGIAHLHNFFWKLDFDLNGTSTDDYAEQLDALPSNGRLEHQQQPFLREAARSINPASLRRWRVVDGRKKNANHLPISYEIRIHQAEHKDIGPAHEAFTHNDFYVTRQKSCERFASRNPTADNCAQDLAAFVDDENLVNQDIVTWVGSTFYHMPRSEDAPHMDAHWSFISLTPRDWFDSHPLSSRISRIEPPTPPTNGQRILYQESFENGHNGWQRDPDNQDSAKRGQWEAAPPAATYYLNHPIQAEQATAGNRALLTGADSGARIGSYDLDGGLTSIRSPLINLPTEAITTLSFDYYFSHLHNATEDDFFRVSIQTAQAKSPILEIRGQRLIQESQWQSAQIQLNDFAGKKIRILVEAADQGSGSIIEAALDNMVLRVPDATAPQVETPTQPPNQPRVIYENDFEAASDWVVNGRGTDRAIRGLWERGKPEETRYRDVAIQPGQAARGEYAFITGPQAGRGLGTHDIDQGHTSIQSPAIFLPENQQLELELSYFLAHLWNTTTDDYLRISIESEQGGQTVLLEVTADGSNKAARWQTFRRDISAFVGQYIKIHIEAADHGQSSLIEAGVDNIRIMTKP